MKPALRGTIALALCAATCAVHGAGARLIVQSSPLAGFQFYAARDVWAEMKAGDALELVREADNTYDANAVCVLWRGRMLGYVPRRDNAHVARQLDHGARIQARIVKLTEHPNPRQRIEFEIYVDL
ncbi:MAG: HIRAN domain-containing protein [Rhodospirillaceae bacterium]